MTDQARLANHVRPQAERPFEATVRAPKTAEVVANHIRSRIVRGELSEGDFLPPEGQLMARCISHVQPFEKLFVFSRRSA